MIKRLLGVVFLLLVHFSVDAQLTIQLRVPEGTPLADTLFVAGTFNNWNPRDNNWRLNTNGSGTYQITFPSQVRGAIQFKFTRGSWATVEANASGGDVANRLLMIPNIGSMNQNLTVLGWKDVLIWPGPNSSAQPNVSILSNSFRIPQLSRTRRIWLYLPPDYHQSQRRYRVLYMHDGQNLFDNATSFSGEWRVDETLNALHAQGDSGAIVVGIENGGSTRMSEYNPWVNPQYGGGEGDAYLNFITQTLKPYIDSNYRTITDPEHTGLVGSSMGGLISLYGGLRNPEVFGRVGALSTALWIAPAIYPYVANATSSNRSNQRFHLLIGGREGNGTTGYSNPYVQDQQRMARTFSAAGYTVGTAGQVDTATILDGQHAEWFWAGEFGGIYQWLFRPLSSPTSVKPILAGASSVAPNPVQSCLPIQITMLASSEFILRDMMFKEIKRGHLKVGKNEISTDGLPPGTYLLCTGNATNQKIQTILVR